ncbi:MAG: hypothetical protein IH591_20800 [Bacteroidales bacterium]|nr:hypothetical protein [Bacteroidales bacterium]
MKKIIRLSLPVILLAVLPSLHISAQKRVYNLPDLDGKVTLKCDFHMHTVFSDGNVWPTVRVDEAFRDGLDAISISDHIEYIPNKEYIPTDFNAAWKITQTYAKERNIILVNGTEITRSMPPGHFNALFIDDASKLDKTDFLEAVEEGIKQGAFIQWNHPGWKAQEPDGIPKLYDVHKELLKKGWLHGIEFYNDVEYYPLVLEICREYNLAIIGNSDVHGLISEEFPAATCSHRPMTLVFAEERSHDSLREAMFRGETIVWFNNMIAGKESLLREFFDRSITIAKPFHENDKSSFIEITNHTDIPYILVNGPQGAPSSITLKANSVTRIVLPKTFNGRLAYDVSNALTGEKSVLKVIL